MSIQMDLVTGALRGTAVTQGGRKLGDLKGFFLDQAAWSAMDPSLEVYRVEAFQPQPEGVPGAICCATTFLMPGEVAGEYFMTRGHYHDHPDGPELEVCVSGEGALILMDADRNTRVEWLSPGSVHHVGPRTAHKAANTGKVPLVFISFWASELGHDYATIVQHGFSARLLNRDGQPTLIAVDPQYSWPRTGAGCPR